MQPRLVLGKQHTGFQFLMFHQHISKSTVEEMPYALQQNGRLACTHPLDPVASQEAVGYPSDLVWPEGVRAW
jgi:hypothetical protein